MKRVMQNKKTYKQKTNLKKDKKIQQQQKWIINYALSICIMWYAWFEKKSLKKFRLKKKRKDF